MQHRDEVLNQENIFWTKNGYYPIDNMAVVRNGCTKSSLPFYIRNEKIYISLTYDDGLSKEIDRYFTEKYEFSVSF